MVPPMARGRWFGFGVLLAACVLACSEQGAPPKFRPFAEIGDASPPSRGTAPAASVPPAVPTCDGPPCPLYYWMAAKPEAALVSADFSALAADLDAIVNFAPNGYPNWASIARDGAAAARIGDGDAVRAACRACHDQYRDRYKRDLRSRPI
jgi:hypothetical protein